MQTAAGRTGAEATRAARLVHILDAALWQAQVVDVRDCGQVEASREAGRQQQHARLRVPEVLHAIGEWQ